MFGGERLRTKKQRLGIIAASFDAPTSPPKGD
jgi:hypothetical protein